MREFYYQSMPWKNGLKVASPTQWQQLLLLFQTTGFTASYCVLAQTKPPGLTNFSKGVIGKVLLNCNSSIS